VVKKPLQIFLKKDLEVSKKGYFFAAAFRNKAKFSDRIKFLDLTRRIRNPAGGNKRLEGRLGLPG